ncbi:MAG: terminase [Polyangiaceae bacterium]
MEDERAGGLVKWQWSKYSIAHTSRKNLTVHAITNPLFLSGTLVLVTSPLAGWPAAVTGGVLLLLALAIQGWGHKQEAEPPIPFRGPADVIQRFFVEQWINFPRFVLSGGFARAWRDAR